MILHRLLAPLGVAQVLLGARVLARFVRSAGGQPIRTTAVQPAANRRVAVIVPVLNEIDRLAPCLEGLIAQGTEVAAILVVDGGSTDGTPELIRSFSDRDARVRLVDAATGRRRLEWQDLGAPRGRGTGRPRCTLDPHHRCDVRLPLC